MTNKEVADKLDEIYKIVISWEETRKYLVTTPMCSAERSKQFWRFTAALIGVSSIVISLAGFFGRAKGWW